jgi:hypothetical protein
MASADAGELLAYADVSDLFSLIEAQWPLFEPLLPPLTRWQGTVDELVVLRNRNAHCRRPHRDDVARLEQVLRNLESGARRFYVSYLYVKRVRRDSKDPLARAWIGGEHPTASRLLGHARLQYNIGFSLGYSVRPWASQPDASRIAGNDGVLWHARWIGGENDPRPVDLWREVSALPAIEPLLVHLLVDLGSVTATFSALEDPAAVADAIGQIFDQIVMTGTPLRLGPDEAAEDFMRRWRRSVDQLPRRVQVDSPLTLVDPMQPSAFSIFDAG